MTCIVGLLHKNKVYIGGDSAGVDARNLCIRPRADEKVFWNGDFLIGISGSFRMGNILRYRMEIPVPEKGIDMRKYMSTVFVDTVQEAFVSGELVEDKLSGFPGTFLVGYKDGLFEVHSDYQVGISENDYSAIGCGDSYALGAMRSSAKKDPEKKIFEALEAAEEYSAGVQRPFRIFHT